METLPVPATGAALAEQHRRGVNLALDASMAANTREAYRIQWAEFDKWCAAHGYQALPAGPETVAAYLVARFEAGAAYSSAQVAKCAIAKVHAAAGQSSPVTAAVRQVLQGLRRQAAPQRQAAPMRWEQADAAAQLAAQDGLAGLRDAALINVMSDAMLRVSELRALDVEDLEAEAANTVVIRRSKTDQTAEGVVLALRASTVKRVRTWLAAAGIETGVMFRRVRYAVDGGRAHPGRLAVHSIRVIVRSRAQAAGVEGAVSGHSLRVGGAQSYAAAGASLVEMQLAGRWKSPDMPGRYARGEMAGRGPLRKYRGK